MHIKLGEMSRIGTGLIWGIHVITENLYAVDLLGGFAPSRDYERTAVFLYKIHKACSRQGAKPPRKAQQNELMCII